MKGLDGTPPKDTLHQLEHTGHSSTEIESSVILADPRRLRRLCDARRDDRGPTGTLCPIVVERAFHAKFLAGESEGRERAPALHPTRQLSHSIDL